MARPRQAAKRGPARRDGIGPRKRETVSAVAARLAGGCAPAGSPTPPCLAHVDDEVEARRHAGARASDPHQQLAMEEVVAGVGGLAGEHMTAIAEAAIVIGAAVVRMPQVNERALDGPAAAGEHIACKLDGPAFAARLAKVEPLGRARAIERAFGLGQRRWIVVLAFGRRDEIGLRPNIAGTSTAGGSDPGKG